jgi:hypothetical protein
VSPAQVEYLKKPWCHTDSVKVLPPDFPDGKVINLVDMTIGKPTACEMAFVQSMRLFMH